MSQLKNDPAAISNWFDEVERGVGPRGSTFTDVDAVSHDMTTRRFLFREFKQEHESLSAAQRMVLRDLAHLPRCTVWFVRKVNARTVGFGVFGSGRPEERITIQEYRRRLGCWWRNEPWEAPEGPVTAEDVRWS